MESDTTTAYSNISASSSLARQQDITESSEEDQLAAAIAASLERQPMEEQNDTEMEIEEEMKEEEIVVETLPPEPADGVPDVTRVQIRTPDGSRLIRRFMKTDKISLLWTFVREQVRHFNHLHPTCHDFSDMCFMKVPEARTRSFELRIAFPPSALAFSEVDTLADRKLENASLMVGWT
jgi:hypothetical protein